jgi:hypothetical protein
MYALKKTIVSGVNASRDLAAKSGVAAMLAIAAASASAQSTDPFDTAVAAMTTKVTSYGGALVAFAAVAVAFFVAMKYIKKIPKAA